MHIQLQLASAGQCLLYYSCTCVHGKSCVSAAADGQHVQAGAIAVVDNSMLAPVFAQPLSLGADICMTSATKFIGGHSDITAGILSVKDPALAERIAFVQARPSTQHPCC